MLLQFHCQGTEPKHKKMFISYVNESKGVHSFSVGAHRWLPLDLIIAHGNYKKTNYAAAEAH